MYRSFLPLFAALIGVGAGAIWLLAIQHQTVDQEVQRQLEMVGQFRAGQLTAWREHVLADSAELAERPQLAKSLLAATQEGAPDQVAPLLKELKAYRTAMDIRDILLLDATGTPRLSATGDGAPLDRSTQEAVVTALRDRRAVLSELHLDSASREPQICAVTPLMDRDAAEGPAAGALLLVFDADPRLFSLLMHWPVQSETAETYLVRREGDTVHVLSPLRHAPGRSLDFRIPIGQRENSAVQAALGVEGTFKGLDYRGNPVIADLRAIPGSSWHLVAEMSQDEAFATWHWLRGMSLALLGALVAILLLGGVLLWQRKQKGILRSLAEAGATAARMNKLYRMLSKTNELIVCATSRMELLEGVARIAVEQGHFLFAWVGEPQPNGKVNLVARAGEMSVWMDQILITTNPNAPHGRGLTGQVLRHGRTVVCNDFLAAPDTAPWHAEARIAAIGAAAVFPLHFQGTLFGTLNLYAAQNDFFGEGEVETLERMTSDISNALDNLAKNAEHARLFASLSSALQVVESSPAVLFRWKAVEGFPVEYVSSNVRQWGYSPEDFVSGHRAYESILHPGDMAHAPGELARALHAGQDSRSVTYRIHNAHGETRWVEDVTSVVRDAAGAVVCVAGVVTDITERKEASARLAESEERLRLALSSAQQGLYDLNLKTGEAIVTAEYAAMLGYEPASFTETNDTWLARLHPEDHDRVKRTLEDYLAGARNEYRVEFRQRTQSGSWLWTLSIGKVVERDAEGRPLRMVGTHADITPMKQAEQLLRVQSASLEAAANGIVITGQNAAIVWANSAFVRLTGYPLEECLGRDPSELVQSGQHDAAFYQQMWDVILSGQEWNGELINRRKDGSLYVAEMTITPVLDARGIPTHYVGIQQDITARKRAEERIRALGQAADQTSDGIVIHGLEGDIRYVNPAWAQMHGYDLDALIGKNIVLFYTPDQFRTEITGMMASLLSSGYFGGDVMHARSDGSRFPTRMTISLMRDQDGNPTGVVAIARDTTDETRAANALQRSQERLTLAVTAGHVGFWDWDIVKNTFECSDAWCEQTGRDRSRMTGTIADRDDRIHPEDAPADLAQRRRLDSVPDTSYTQEIRLLHQEGSYAWFLENITVLRNPAGKPVRIFAASVDITERKRLEEQFRQAQKLESIGRLAGGVAHDFNNLLGVILGYTEMGLDAVPEDHPLHQDLIQIKRASLRAADLTRQLLAFSRRQVLRPELLSLNAVIAQAEKMLVRMLGEDIQITTLLDDQLGRVLADPGQVEQVLLNLAVNARDAMPHGGSLTIQTSNVELGRPHADSPAELPPGAYAAITVTDTGTGMDRDTLNHLFEPFFTTKEQGKGTGLGLATVYGIVQQSGGAITVSSELGRGTAFKIYLPRVNQTCDDMRIEPEEPVQGGSETILLVEDEPAVRELTRRSLAAIGYNVITAASAEEALQIVHASHDPVDLLLTDVIMPGISGAVLAAKMLDLYPNLPVLFMSGYTDDAIAHHGVLDEGTHLINKPFRLADLAIQIRTRLEAVDGVAHE